MFALPQIEIKTHPFLKKGMKRVISLLGPYMTDMTEVLYINLDKKPLNCTVNQKISSSSPGNPGLPTLDLDSVGFVEWSWE